VSNEPLEPMDPELESLLDGERKAVPPAASLARVWSRLQLSVPQDGGNPERGGGHGGNGLTPGWLASHALPVALGTFVAGVVTGAAGYSVLRSPPLEHVVYVERPAPQVSAAAASEERDDPRPVAPPSTASGDHPPLRLPAAPARSSSLSAERVLLDDARGALAAGEPARALSLLDEHARRYPRAQLAEEREALSIQALVLLGRYVDARARAARFRAAAPNSLFLPAIEASLATIP
jgi:hypothetical protein